MQLYAHPFSSYCQKALIALYENATPFEYRNLEDAAASAELASLWPLKRFPVLVDRGRTRFRPRAPTCAPIGPACWPGRPSRARWTRRGPTAATFPSVRRIATERRPRDDRPRRTDGAVLAVYALAGLFLPRRIQRRICRLRP